MKFSRTAIKILIGLKTRLNKYSKCTPLLNHVLEVYEIVRHEYAILNKRADDSQNGTS